MQKYPEFPVMIVDDDQNICFSMSSVLRASGINNIMQCQESRNLMSLLRSFEVEIVLLDLIMPGVKGEELLSEIKREFPETLVIIVTGKDDLSTAVGCMKSGAFDYISKPVDENILLPSLRRAIRIQELRRENRELTKHFLDQSIKNPSAFSEITTRNPKMKNLLSYCEAISQSSQPILITGETGTGKELFARAIHKLTGREGKFVAVNVSGLDLTVFSDTLFGHVKGAFTGAASVRNGMIEEAKGGTLFLDEIGDLEEANQVKLLRLLQEREYSPLGSDTTKLTDSKIVVATHKNLYNLVNSNQFRRDLYYRLQTHHIHIPPLRERKEDIPLLLDDFIEEACRDLKKKKPSYPEELLLYLENHDFPGNIRELRSMIYDAVTGHKSRMLSVQAFGGIRENSGIENRAAVFGNIYRDMSKLPSIKESSSMLIEEAMKRASGNQRVAASLLGITQQALSRRLKTQKKKSSE